MDLQFKRNGWLKKERHFGPILEHDFVFTCYFTGLKKVDINEYRNVMENNKVFLQVCGCGNVTTDRLTELERQTRNTFSGKRCGY